MSEICGDLLSTYSSQKESLLHFFSEKRMNMIIKRIMPLKNILFLVIVTITLLI